MGFVKKIFIFLVFLCACTKKPNAIIAIDGSSTVYPLTEAVAEEYRKINNSQVSISVSGTGSGFKKLCQRHIMLIEASREIKDIEKVLCRKNNVDPLEIPIAYDGIVVLVNNSNNFISDIDVETLKKIFEPKGKNNIKTWQDINPSWPKRKIQLFAPGISSGTYDYFTKAIVGQAQSSRSDIITSEDDNVLVHGIKSNIDSLGFFSFAYYLENQNDLKALAIRQNNHELVLPTALSIKTNSYKPLSRLIYLYIDKNHLNQNIKDFLLFYLTNSKILALEVGFVELNEDLMDKTISMIKALEVFNK